MGRRLGLGVLGVLLVAGSLAPRGGATADPDRSRPLLLSGSLTTRGRIFIYANGREVASAAATPGYRVGLPETPFLASLASSNGGYVNFDVVATDGSRVHVFGFSKRYDARGGAWVTGRALPAPRRMDLDRAGHISAGAGRLMAGDMICGKVLLSTDRSVSTTVGEVHTHGRWVTDTVTYGRTADSNISVGVSPDGSRWSFSGAFHVGNTNGAAVSWVRAGPYGHRVETDFDYAEYAWVPFGICGDYEIDPVRWDGAATYGSDNSGYDGRCGSTYAAYAQEYGPGTSFTRSTNRYVTFSVAATPFGVAGFTAQSGASTDVTMRWTFGQRSGTRTLCGNDGFPTASSRIFQGG